MEDVASFVVPVAVMLVVASIAEALSTSSFSVTTMTRRPMVDEFRLTSAASSSLDGTINSNNEEKAGDRDENSDDDDLVDLASVSDEEALLACASHLRRKHRLRWKGRDERRAKAARSVDDAGGGYFWDNPDELRYLRPRADPTTLWEMDEVDVMSGGASSRRRSRRGCGEEEDEAGYFLIGPGSRRGGLASFDDDDDDDEGANAGIDDDDDEDDDEDEDEGRQRDDPSTGGPFTSFPQYPPPEQVRRSEKARSRWSDPSWRERWYERRWGGGAGRRPDAADEARKARSLRRRLTAVSPDVLTSEELASMSEEDLEDAIRTYVRSNRRRAESQRKRSSVEAKARRLRRTYPSGTTATGGRHVVGDGKVKAGEMNDNVQREPETSVSAVTFEPSEEMLKAVRRKRSKRSTRAYATRLANDRARRKRRGRDGAAKIKKGAKTPGSPHGSWSSSSPKDSDASRNRLTTTTQPVITGIGTMMPSAKEALDRIEAALDVGEVPSPIDVQITLRPFRLSRRRDVFRRVLSDVFDLRGRCVPTVEDEDEDVGGGSYAEFKDGSDRENDMRLQFVTSCPIDDLGFFVLARLRERVRDMSVE